MKSQDCVYIMKNMSYLSRLEFIKCIKETSENSVIVNNWQAACDIVNVYEINLAKKDMHNSQYIQSLSNEELRVLKEQISDYILRLSTQNTYMSNDKDLVEANNIEKKELHDLLNVVNKEIEDRKAVEILNNYNQTLKHHL